MSDEIKPCPFCGSTASMEYGDHGMWYVYCDNRESGKNSCQARILHCLTEKQAINQWNRRVDGEGNMLLQKPDLSGLTVSKSGEVVKKETMVISKERYSELIKNDILCTALIDGFSSMKSDPDPQVQDFAKKADIVISAVKKTIDAIIGSAGGVK